MRNRREFAKILHPLSFAFWLVDLDSLQPSIVELKVFNRYFKIPLSADRYFFDGREMIYDVAVDLTSCFHEKENGTQPMMIPQLSILLFIFDLFPSYFNYLNEHLIR